MVPVVHNDSHAGSVADGLLQLAVCTRDVLQNHREIVLIAAAGALHHHRRTNRHGRHDDVGENEVFWTAGELVDPQQRKVFGRDQFEEIQHDLRGQVFL